MSTFGFPRYESQKMGTPLFSVLFLCCAFSAMLLAVSLFSSSIGPGHPKALIRATQTQKDVHHGDSTCVQDRKIVNLFQELASHAADSYMLEEVLFQQLASSSCRPLANVQLDKVLFVLMCSSDKQERIGWLLETWLAWLPPQNMLLLSDVEIPGYPLTILPPLPADDYIKTRFPNPTNYQAANLRHLKSVQWLGKVNTTALQHVDWVFLVDDDTFVNLPLLLIYLRHIPPSLPLLFGHLWDSPSWDTSLKGIAYPSGGAGMLFSKVAFQQLAQVLFTPVCDMQTFLNDVTIGSCSMRANITKVHSLKFLPERIQGTYNPVISDVGMVLTMHRAVEKRYLVDSTCVVSKRFGWPHELCSNFSVICDPLCHAKR